VAKSAGERYVGELQFLRQLAKKAKSVSFHFAEYGDARDVRPVTAPRIDAMIRLNEWILRYQDNEDAANMRAAREKR